MKPTTPRIPTPGPFAGAVALMPDKGLAELACTPEITQEGEPLVRLEALRRGTGQKLVGQMTPNEIRGAAFNMLLVAENAESDAALFRYLTTAGGLEAPMALAAVGYMRSLRAGPDPETPTPEATDIEQEDPPAYALIDRDTHLHHRGTYRLQHDHPHDGAHEHPDAEADPLPS